MKNIKLGHEEHLFLDTMEEIYLAGGCFWGIENYFKQIQGVVKTDVGYANGKTENPTYEQVCSGNTGYAETVHVVYDTEKVPLSFILQMYIKVIDPTTVDRQGNDYGNQYRTGIYYKNINDKEVIEEFLKELSKQYVRKLAVECLPLKNYYLAEDYHQNYLIKNPGGYCHISKAAIAKAKLARPKIKISQATNNMEEEQAPYQVPDDKSLRKTLTPRQYGVTKKNETEPPFQNEYWDKFEEGIYVEIVTGEPLFLSADKFDSGCGWPSFSRPITREQIKETTDRSHGMNRIEVRSKYGNSHLGHVFEDGPVHAGGLRYCINSASLRFIPKEQMEEEGYGDYLFMLGGVN